MSSRNFFAASASCETGDNTADNSEALPARPSLPATRIRRQLLLWNCDASACPRSRAAVGLINDQQILRFILVFASAWYLRGQACFTPVGQIPHFRRRYYENLFSFKCCKRRIVYPFPPVPSAIVAVSLN